MLMRPGYFVLKIFLKLILTHIHHSTKAIKVSQSAIQIRYFLKSVSRKMHYKLLYNSQSFASPGVNVTFHRNMQVFRGASPIILIGNLVSSREG